MMIITSVGCPSVIHHFVKIAPMSDQFFTCYYTTAAISLVLTGQAAIPFLTLHIVQVHRGIIAYFKVVLGGGEGVYRIMCAPRGFLTFFSRMTVVGMSPVQPWLHLGHTCLALRYLITML